jgi:prepilin-type processing-associated H-X9-DG protein
MLSLPLTVLLALAAAPQAAADATQAVAPFVGQEVGIVVHADLSRIDFLATIKRLAGPFAAEKDFQQGIGQATGVVDSLKKAGAKDAYVLIDPTDMPGLPLIVFTVTPGTDPQPLRDVLAGLIQSGHVGSPVEVIGKAVVTGSPDAVAHARTAKNPRRAELAEAFAATGNAPAQVLIIPTKTQRRALEEAVPTLPPPLGGGPITTLTQGMKWGALSMMTEPEPSLKLVVQASDATAAAALEKLAADSKKLSIELFRSQPQFADMIPAFEKIAPQVKDDQVVVEMSPRVLGDILIPPIQSAREAARRTQCVNNLKQIALAMHNYHSAREGRFPGAYIADKNSKPLLSWRVQILPFLDQNALYEQFHLDEPWDSAHNKALIAQMPKTYACPSGNPELAAQGKTPYLVPRGKGTIFPGAEGVKIQDITDGTSNTILVAEANDDASVIWTKPDDWEIGETVSVKNLQGHHPAGTNLAFADGSVRFVSVTLDPKVLKELLTRDGGEVIDQAEFTK